MMKKIRFRIGKYIRRKILEWLLKDGIPYLRVGENTVDITGIDITLPSLTSDPSLAKGKIWFRGDLGQLRISPDGSNVKQVYPAYWNDIQGKPSTYPPSSHTHSRSEITDFWSSPFWQNIPDKPSAFPPEEHNHDDRYYTKTQLQTSGQAQVHWNNITNKPSTYPPSSHTHPRSQITDFWASPFWNNIPDKPSTFPPSAHGSSHEPFGTDEPSRVWSIVDSGWLNGFGMYKGSKQRFLGGAVCYMHKFSPVNSFIGFREMHDILPNATETRIISADYSAIKDHDDSTRFDFGGWYYGAGSVTDFVQYDLGGIKDVWIYVQYVNADSYCRIRVYVSSDGSTWNEVLGISEVVSKITDFATFQSGIRYIKVSVENVGTSGKTLGSSLDMLYSLEVYENDGTDQDIVKRFNQSISDYPIMFVESGEAKGVWLEVNRVK